MFETTSTNPTNPLPRDLALRMIPTIHRVARQLARRLPRHIRIDDLVGAGCQGLVAAYARFDPARADGFDAFAEMRIRGAMLDELRSRDPLSRDQRAHAKKAVAATRALAGRLGRAPAADEVAAELGIPLDLYWERQSAAAVGFTVSIDDDGGDVGSQLCDTHVEAADDRLCRKEARDAVKAAIASLPPRLARVLDLHYGQGLTLRQIGEQFGVTESRVCQLEAEAIRRVREQCQSVDDGPMALAA
jgi:RNA polymerase sigma factor for flagellar operon FliA